MKNAFLAGILLAAMAGSAMAADLPVAGPVTPAPVYPKAQSYFPGYNWSGFFVGINGGGAWGRSRFDFPATTTGNFSTSGGEFGATIGDNFQFSFVVFGFEGDFDWASIKGSAVCTAPIAGATCQSGDNLLATARGRLGIAVNNWLFYGTGGGAFGDVKLSVAGSGFPGQDVYRAGWAGGAGIEYGYGQAWSVKAEYLHVDLGSSQCTAPNCAAVAQVSVPYTADIFRAGLNYRFGWGGPIVARY